MPCTTILVGKHASYDGSTMIARSVDEVPNYFSPAKAEIVTPDKQPKVYHSVGGNVDIELPDNPMRYSSMPSADLSDGIWAAGGINEANVAMTATESISSNPRVLGADPLVKADEETNQPGGIGEEDMATLVLPYIKSAREGVMRLGKLLEQYGTCEMNGIGFSDADEVWWFETIGGHHWIAKRLSDNQYAVISNQMGIDSFDLNDAFGKKDSHMCSEDLIEFIKNNNLNLSLTENNIINPRLTFGTNIDYERVFSAPRVWGAQQHLSKSACDWAALALTDGDLKWSMNPDNKITPEDVKYVLGYHYQFTPYDTYSNEEKSGIYRSAGVETTDSTGLLQLRPNKPADSMGIHWMSFGNNTFNALIPIYANVDQLPEYLTNTDAKDVDVHNFYWASRLIEAISAPHYQKAQDKIFRYQRNLQNDCNHVIYETDKKIIANNLTGDALVAELVRANQSIADLAKSQSNALIHALIDLATMDSKSNFSNTRLY